MKDEVGGGGGSIASIVVFLNTDAKKTLAPSLLDLGQQKMILVSYKSKLGFHLPQVMLLHEVKYDFTGP